MIFSVSLQTHCSNKKVSRDVHLCAIFCVTTNEVGTAQSNRRTKWIILEIGNNRRLKCWDKLHVQQYSNYSNDCWPALPTCLIFGQYDKHSNYQYERIGPICILNPAERLLFLLWPSQPCPVLWQPLLERRKDQSRKRNQGPPWWMVGRVWLVILGS